MLTGGREDVQDATAHRYLSAPLDEVDSLVPQFHQSLHAGVEVDGRAYPDADRLYIRKPGGNGLQDGSYRGDQHIDRRQELIVRIWMGKTA